MLRTLRIRNLAVIESTEVEFGNGLNILSGETGAGKSILLESIALILGARGNSDLVRKGAEEAVVEGIFDLESLPEIRARMKELDIPANEETLLVRRVVGKTGKAKIYLNGELSTLSNLQKVAEGLVDLCSQNEHQSLLKSEVQLQLIDRYGGLDEHSAKFRDLFQKYSVLFHKIETALNEESRRAQKIDFLKFQIQEIENQNPVEGEDDKLQVEKKYFQSFEQRDQILKSLFAVFQADDDNGGGLEQHLKEATQKMSSLTALDPSLNSLEETLNSISTEASEWVRDLDTYSRKMDFDPERWAEVQERIAALASLKRKYGPSLAAVLSTLDSLRKELNPLESIETDLETWRDEVTKLEKKLKSDGDELNNRRSKAAKLFSDSITVELRELKMADARFEAAIEKFDRPTKYSAVFGPSKVEYRIQTNRGDEAKPLGKIASGGELSRVMLAVRRVISDRGGIGVYLFDEIDTGMSGETAFVVGKKLKSVSKHNQVLCITHLPQVASFADHHFTVEKEVAKGKTFTTVKPLNAKASLSEIARMLGGPRVTPSSLRNAEELLGQAENL